MHIGGERQCWLNILHCRSRGFANRVSRSETFQILSAFASPHLIRPQPPKGGFGVYKKQCK